MSNVRGLVGLLGCALALGAACDGQQAAEVKAEAEAPAEAMVATQEEATRQAVEKGAPDLQKIVDEIDSGEIETAADLEARLEANGAAKVDMDGDGENDHLHVVEHRTETSARFEVRAVGSARAEVEIEDAPLVAVLELEPKEKEGVVIVHASYAPEYAASVSVDVEATTIHHQVHGATVDVHGEVVVEAHTGAFVEWTFRPARPVFVASVFIVHEHHDHCWPPGHCKHGKWKAGGEHPGHGGHHGTVHSAHHHGSVKFKAGGSHHSGGKGGKFKGGKFKGGKGGKHKGGKH